MNVFGKRGSTLVLLVALGAALAPAAARAEVLVRPHAEMVSPAMFAIAVGDGSSPVGVDVVWNQPLEDSAQNPVRTPVHYYLLVGRPWEFSRVYTETIQAASCTTIASPTAPDVQRCSRHLDFPIALPGGDQLAADDKYAIGVTTVFDDATRSDGHCDNGEPIFGDVSCNAGGGTWPGYGYTEVLVKAGPWRVYQSSDIASRASSPFDLVYEVLLVDPPSKKFEFVVWNWFDLATTHRGAFTAAIPLGDRMMIAGTGEGVTITGAYGPEDAQALLVFTNPLADVEFFDAVRKF